MRVASLSALIVLASCLPPNGPRPDSAMVEDLRDGASRFRGRLRIGFELSAFNGCWANLGSYGDSFELPPQGSGGVHEYEIEFIGVSRGARPGARGRGYGHLGHSACEYEIRELISSRRVPS